MPKSFLYRIGDKLGIGTKNVTDPSGDALESSLDTPRPLQMFELEPRILYSASPIPVDGADLDPGLNDTAEPLTPMMEPDDSSGFATPILQDENSQEPEQEPLAPIDDLMMADSDFVEVVFVDSGVEDLQLILDDLALNRPNAIVEVLESDRNGVEQISEFLAGRMGIDAIHVISHGDDGQIQLGNTTLSNDTIDRYAGQIAQWSSALSADADILFYGCNLAGTENGEAFIDAFAMLTGADIAASNDLTGNAELGGDWILEVSSGMIEADIVLSASAQENFSQVLMSSNVITVTTTSDVSDGDVSSISNLLASRGADGVISLREAIEAANNTANGSGPDEIVFDIPDSDAGRFYYQDDGIAGSLSIVAATNLDESLITDFDPDHPFASQTFFRIDLSSALPTITDAVIIDGYSQSGASENTLASGQNASLRIELTHANNSNSDDGIVFGGGRGDSTLAGLAIHGFGGNGITINGGAENVTIRGNFIGTDITGTIALGNSVGVSVTSPNSVIGGASVADRNIISGNSNRGVVVSGDGDFGLIENNFIGVDSSGLRDLGNSDFGVALIATDGVEVTSNVISGNETDGIRLSGFRSQNNIIQGNFIGVGSDGVTVVANSGSGIRSIARNADDNIIGGAGAGEGNVVSGNAFQGIVLDGPNSRGNIILGNAIGTDLTGTEMIGNGANGILLADNARDNVIGGEGNIIAFNGQDGIALASNGNGNNDGNTIRGNQIFENDGIGIDLGDNGVSPNDGSEDNDSGPNRLQNFPTLTLARFENGELDIEGTINSEEDTNFTIDFYANTESVREGARFLGAITVQTDDDGEASFITSIPTTQINPGEFITATATHEDGSTSEFAANIAVDLVAQPMPIPGPTLGNNQLTLEEGETVVLDSGVLSATDPLGIAGDLTFIISNVSGGRFAFASDTTTAITSFTQDQVSAGEVVFVDDGDEDAPSYDVSVSNGTIEIGPTPAIIDFTNVNDDPTVANPIGMIDLDEDAPDQTIDLTSVFTDVDDASLTFTVLSNDNSALVAATVESGSDLVLDLEANQSGTASIVIQATDAAGATVTDTITLNVAPVNDDPTVANPIGVINVQEDAPNQTIDLTGVFADVDDASLTFTVLSNDNSALVAATVESGSDLVLDLEANQSGTASIVVQATDAAGATVTDTVTLNVFPVNDDPTVANPIGVINVQEDAPNQTIDLTGVFADVDDASLTYTVLSNDNAALVAATIESGSDLVLDLEANQSGTASIVVQATDAAGATVTDTVTLNVFPVNDDPTVANPIGVINVQEDAPDQTIDLTNVFADIDDASLTYTVLSNDNAALVAATIESGSDLVLDLEANQFGTASIVIQATDAAGATVTDTITLNVSPVNDDPAVANPIGVINVQEDAPNQTIDLTNVFADVDDASLTFTILSNDNAALVAATVESGSDLVLDLEANQFGTASIVVQATDAAGATVTDTITLNVSPVNNAPTVANPIGMINVQEDAPNQTIDLTGVFADVDDASLTFTILSNDNAALVAATIESGSDLVLDLEDGQSGTASIVVQATDAAGATVTDTITLNVSPVNNAPTVANPIGLINVQEDAPNQTIDLTGVFADVDDASLTFTILSNDNAALVAATIESGSDLVLDLEANQFGTAFIVIQATDAAGATVTDTITLNVSPVNDDPAVANPIGVINVQEDAPNQTNDLTNVFADVDDASLTFTILSNDNAALVAATVESGSDLVLDLEDGQSGIASIVVQATDAAGATVTDTITLNVAPVNDAPTATSQTFTGNPGATTVSGNLLRGASDVENDSLSVELATLPTNGEIRLNPNGTFVFEPEPGFSGTVVFEFFVTDGQDRSATQTATINVVEAVRVPPPPAEDTNPSEEITEETNEEEESEEEEAVTLVDVDREPNDRTTQDVTQGKVRELETTQQAEAIAAEQRRTLVQRVSFRQDARVFLTSSTSIETSSKSVELNNFSPIEQTALLFTSLNELDDDLDSATQTVQLEHLSTLVQLSGVSIGIVTWILRSGAFVASMMMNLPAWRMIDPLTVLGHSTSADDDESLLDIVEDKRPPQEPIETA